MIVGTVQRQCDMLPNLSGAAVLRVNGIPVDFRRLEDGNAVLSVELDSLASPGGVFACVEVYGQTPLGGGGTTDSDDVMVLVRDSECTALLLSRPALPDRGMQQRQISSLSRR